MLRIILLVLAVPIPVAETDKLQTAETALIKFKAVVDEPLPPKSFLKTEFAAQATDFLDSVYPFGEVFATSLRSTISEDDMKALKHLNYGVHSKLSIIKDNMARYEGKYSSHLGDYYELVHHPISHFVHKIYLLTSRNVSRKEAERFGDQCDRDLFPTLHSLEGSAMYCLNTVLSTKIETTLFDFLNKFTFDRYILNNEEEKVYRRLYYLLYSCLSWQSEDRSAGTLHTFLRNGKRHYNNKMDLLRDVLKAFGIDENRKIQGTCSPFTSFLLSNYDRNSVLKFREVVTQHLYLLELIIPYCSNHLHFNYTRKIELQMTIMKRMLEPVYSWLSEWSNDLLHSTWPTKETHLVSGFITTFAGNQPISEDKEEYQEILKNVSEAMKNIGHPHYRRSYIFSKGDNNRSPSVEFVFSCTNGTCSKSSANGGQCVILRSQFESDSGSVSLQKLTNFTTWLQPVLSDLMAKKFYWFEFLKYIVYRLNREHGINFNDFHNHTSYVILRKRQYRSGCEATHAAISDSDLDWESLRNVTYHNDGTIFENCHDFQFFFGV